jgi:hypothetical protein
MKKNEKHYLEENREENKESVGISIEKTVVKVNNCTFWLGILDDVAGDALKAFGKKSGGLDV